MDAPSTIVRGDGAEDCQKRDDGEERKGVEVSSSDPHQTHQMPAQHFTQKDVEMVVVRGQEGMRSYQLVGGKHQTNNLTEVGDWIS